MTATDLQHFFEAWREFKAIGWASRRGKFGTGKSAAFGIASTLRVDTTRAAKRNVVSLSRDMIEQSGGQEIPVKWEIRDESVDEPNGTTI